MADPSITDIDPTGDIILIVPADPESGANKRVKTGEDGHSSKPTSPKAQFRVSSKHLTLASAYFKGRLGSHWTEGKILSDRGAAELELAEADPKALSILLHIIHGRTRQVPRCVTPEEVFTLATLTDYLQCQEVIEPFGVSWIKAIESTYAETGLTPRLKQWIAAAVCFRHEIILKTATKIVYMHGTGRFNAGNLPIPRSVIDDMDTKREGALQQLFKFMDQRATQLAQGPISCSSDCDAWCLGFWVRFYISIGLPLHTRKRKPYPGFSVYRIIQSIHSWVVLVRGGVPPCTRGRQGCLNRATPLGTAVSNFVASLRSTEYWTGCSLPNAV